MKGTEKGCVMNQNDAQGTGDTESQDAAEADTLDDRSAQDRKAQLATMLAREQDPEHQARVTKADLAFARRTKAEEKLNRRKKKLNDNPANMDAAEADVTFAQKELRDLDICIEELRGDFHRPNGKSDDDPPSTILQWIELDEGTAGVEFQDLPFLLAKAQSKFGEDGTTIAVRAIQFESELDSLVDRGLVPLKDPLTGEPHEYPYGHARKKAVVRTQDLHNFLARYFATGVRGQTEKEEAHAVPGNRTASQAATPSALPGATPLQRGAAQDAVILAAIQNAGLDPQALPVPPPGKKGAKATIRAALEGVSPLFQPGSRTFNKAWERLRERGEIANRP